MPYTDVPLSTRLILLRIDTEKYVRGCVNLMEPKPTEPAIQDAIEQIYKRMKRVVKGFYR